jgi:hypothetical protein
METPAALLGAADWFRIHSPTGRLECCIKANNSSRTGPLLLRLPYHQPAIIKSMEHTASHRALSIARLLGAGAARAAAAPAA